MTEIEKTPEAGELAPIGAEEQALVDAARSNIDRSKLVLPALKLTQSLTGEVQSGDAEPGEFINSLTGENYGDHVELVVSALFDGRFFSSDGNNYAAQGDIAPDSWPDEYAGKPFADIADAEEQWKAAVNANEHPWGKGPPISTTHNFVGLVVGSESALPVRLSLMRAANPAAFKLQTLIYSARAPWDHTFVLKAKREVNAKNQAYFVPDVSQGGVTPPELRQAAVNLAQEYANAKAAGEVELAGDEATGGAGKKAAPREGAGLSVS